MPTIEATQVKCPECGAHLDIKGNDTVTKCSYCGTAARVERRSPVLEMRQKLPAPKPHEPTPVARQVRTKKGKALFIAWMTFSIGLGPAIVFAVMCSQYTNYEWEGHHVITAKVDGDDIEDFIGFDRNVSRDKMCLVAYSGTTGSRLWRTDSLGKYTDVYQDIISSNKLAGIVLVADKLQHLTAFDMKTGAKKWTITAPEVIDNTCYNVTGEPALIHTADNRTWKLDGATGKLDPVADCPTSPNASTETSHFGETPGMSFSGVYERAGGPNIAFGNRSPGTRVPMIAALDPGGMAIWKADIAGHDPLTTGSELYHSISDHDVAVVYERKSRNYELTMFDRATGKRAFEVPVKALVVSYVGVVDQSVFVETWGSLQVFDRATGKHKFTIGSP